jgi:hypothetical protein
MLLVGIVTTGISYTHALGLTNAVREGARFGAIADASKPSWASDVATRVQQTQMDDPTNTTTVCVQLYKQGGGGAAATCPVTGGPSVSAGDYPAPPTLSAGQCAVIVVASRTYSIDFVVAPAITQPMVRSSIARYEGTNC